MLDISKFVKCSENYYWELWINGLAAIVEMRLKLNMFDGDIVCAFCNKASDILKILEWTGTVSCCI
jgi:hypothetical protein